jgi:hypothetical protein
MPRLRVLVAFPAVVLVLMVIAIALGINGTSSGYLYGAVHEGRDPALLAGEPQAIRSDEWNVGAVWTISQAEQDFPETNTSTPGGSDAAIPQDLPRRDWSVAFRPHLVGYLILPIDQATAWRWWLPAGAVLVLASMFVVTVLPRRPVLGALAGIGLVSAPFFQWWFQSVTFWPTAWGLATMIAAIWAMRSTSRAARWIWAGVAGYLTVVMAMGIYAPYIIPVIIVVALFVAALLIGTVRGGTRVRAAVLRLVPLLIAGGAGGAITLLWIRSKQSVIDGFLSTDYPGERLFPAGGGNAITLARTIGTSFSEYLHRAGGFLGTNSSEASSFFLLGAFLVPVVVWLVVRAARSRSALPFELIGLSAGILLFLVFVFVPGWDALAHLLALDRTTDTRLRIGLGLASFAMLPFLVRELEAPGRGAPGWLAWAIGGVFALSQLAIAGALAVQSGLGSLFAAAPLWPLLAALSTAAIIWLARARSLPAMAAFALVGVATTVGVNPLYVGMLDLRETEAARMVDSVDADGGAWVPIGGALPTALLIETGALTYGGIQGDPSEQMWDEIDPDGQYRPQWNRLANIGWMTGPGDPVVTNPAQDQILITFDACAPFAQQNIRYVLSDQDELDSPCLEALDAVDLPDGRLTSYAVVGD